MLPTISLESPLASSPRLSKGQRRRRRAFLHVPSLSLSTLTHPCQTSWRTRRPRPSWRTSRLCIHMREWRERERENGGVSFQGARRCRRRLMPTIQSLRERETAADWETPRACRVLLFWVRIVPPFSMRGEQRRENRHRHGHWGPKDRERACAGRDR